MLGHLQQVPAPALVPRLGGEGLQGGEGGEGGEGVGGVQADCLITGGPADWSDRSGLGSGRVNHAASHLVLNSSDLQQTDLSPDGC